MKTLIKPNFSFVFIISYLFCAFTSKGEQFRFTHYDIEHGLSSNMVRAIVQDHTGFMWFGTENGLNRFDGNSFKTFKKNMETPGSLGNNYIFSLFEDSGKTLWAGTDNGVYIYHAENECFTRLTYMTEEGILIDSNITCITEDRSGRIWFATLFQGVFCFDPEIKKLVQYKHEANNSHSLTTNRILNMYIDHLDQVWICLQAPGNSLWRLNPVNNRFEPYQFSTSRDISTVHFYAMIEEGFHTLWLGTWNQGVYKLNTRTGEVENFLSPESSNGILHIHSITSYQPGWLLIGSDDGLTLFNTLTHESETMTTSEFGNHSISDNFVYPVYKDREGGIWVGTYYGGINYSAPYTGAIQGYTHSRFKNSVGGKIISCFCEDEKGNIWIGSDDGGLSYFDVTRQQFINYMPDPLKNSLSYHNIHALLIHENELWIGTYSGGLNILDRKTGKFRHYFTETPDAQTIGGNSIYSLFKDRESNIWIGTMNNISIYDSQDRKFKKVKEVGTTTAAIEEDKNGNIWFATLGNGLLSYNISKQEWTHYKSGINNGELICDQVNCIQTDESNNLWIGTDEGICKLDTSRNYFEKIPIEDNNIPVYKIIRERDNLWITTNKGLYRYDLRTEEFIHFTRRDGLQNDQFSNNAGLLTREGLIYLGTTNGFNILNPLSFYPNEYIPPIVFTNLQVFNQDIKFERENNILTGSLTSTKKIELSYKQNVFSLEFAALSFCIPSKNQYKYLLEGFDKDWNYTGNQHKATYTNLPPGKYKLHVAGSNNDGVWNEQGTTLTIIIHPPLWLTPWAYLIYTLLIILTSFLCIRSIKQRSEKRSASKIQQVKEEKEKELYTAKIEFFTMIAHEIRTPVSLIIGPLEKIMLDIKNFSPGIKKNLEMINRNSQRLLTLINQLLDFRKAEEGGFIMNYKSTNVVELLQGIYERFTPLAEQRNISLTFDSSYSFLTATIDPEVVTKITSNLLTNAIKYTKDRIILSFHSDNETFTIQVKDNGCGIPETETDHIFEAFYQRGIEQYPGTGLGLSLVKKLVENHNGMIEVESKENEYAEFTIVLPLQHVSVSSTDETDTYLFAKGYDMKDFLLRETPGGGNTACCISSSGRLPEEEIQHAVFNLSHNKTLLIIEDNPDMQEFICETLSDSYNILTSENGLKGWEILVRTPVDLIICDIMMPVMNGITFTKKLKEDIHYCHIPVILLTAKTDHTSKLKGIETGADAYIEKPFSPEIIQAMIRNLLKGRETLQRKFSEMPFTTLKSMAGNKSEERFLAKINAAIEKNLSNGEFNIDQLARELHVSRPNLFIKIKQLTDMTPNDLIQVIRLKKAAELLVTKEYRINEVCYMVGFNTPSYFAKCFQKQFGMLPKEFISKYNSNEKTDDKII